MPLGRTYFVLGEILVPNGGAHVIIDCADRLAASGRDIGMLYPRPNYAYPHAECKTNGVWSPKLRKLRGKGRNRISEFVTSVNTAVDTLRPNPRWQEYQPQDNDILVVPEYRYPEAMSAFPDQPAVILVQDVFGFLYAFSRDQAAGTRYFENAAAVLTTSEICADAMETMGPKFHGRLQLDIDNELFAFVEKKAFQIAFMPRKRHEETIVFEALVKSRHPDVKLVPIRAASHSEAARMIGESLFFVSFSEREGFGLPPAEAMATGSIVVGYTGVGGNEYFTPQTGFPIEDSDIMAMVRQLDQLITEYRQDPARLDKMRAEASQFITEKYDKVVASSQLVATWTSLETHLT